MVKKKMQLTYYIRTLGLLLILLVSGSVASDVVVLTEENFEKEVGKDRYAFVNFYYPGSFFCETLVPEYEKLSENIKNAANNSVLIGKVDCVENGNICRKYRIQYYPTIKWFSIGSLEPKEYEGQWMVGAFSDFVNTEAGTNLKIENTPSNVVVLTEDNFDEVVLDETKDVLVLFYAPWCALTKALLNTYEQMGSVRGFVVAKLDVIKYTDLANKYGISRHPTLKMFTKGNKSGSYEFDDTNNIESNREMEDFPTLNIFTKRNKTAF